MKGLHIATLRGLLTERDMQLVASLDDYRLLSTRQVQRLHFDPVHPTPLAAARACSRTLARLRDHGVLKALERRVGGVRAGSAGFVWYLGPAGERLLRDSNTLVSRGRRNYREPSRHFVDHTLAVAELGVQAVEVTRDGGIELLDLETEPTSWQTSLSLHGAATTLKPDLRLVTASVRDEFHWFVEADMATEHLGVVLRQCAAYETFRATGRYQGAHGLFPVVLWVVPTPARKVALRAALARSSADHGLGTAPFRVCTTAEFRAALTEATGGND